MNQNKRKVSALDAEAERSLEENLDQLAIDIARRKAVIKKRTNQLDDLKTSFYQAADQYLSEDEYPLTQITLVRPTGMSEAKVREWIQESYPEFRIEHISEVDVVIEEDPSKKKFAWVMDDLGYKVQRIISMVDQSLNTDKLYKICLNYSRNVDSDKRLMYQAILGCIHTKTIHEFDEKKFKKVVDQYPESVAIIQAYLSKGKIRPTLRVDPLTEEK